MNFEEAQYAIIGMEDGWILGNQTDYENAKQVLEVCIRDAVSDLKITLGNLYYALDDTYTGDQSPYYTNIIQPIAQKYGWTEANIKNAVEIF